VISRDLVIIQQNRRLTLGCKGLLRDSYTGMWNFASSMHNVYFGLRQYSSIYPLMELRNLLEIPPFASGYFEYSGANVSMHTG
jgi:hypothetical protein